jgi:hypothetical protein
VTAQVFLAHGGGPMQLGRRGSAVTARRKVMRDRFEESKLTRRSVLISALGSTALLAGMPRFAEAGTKVTQSAVEYQPAPKDGQDCQYCYQFVTPHRCRMVDGDIVPTGWCGLWVKRPA